MQNRRVPDHSDRLATQLLLIARNPVSGRLRHPGVLMIGLRAALLADLVLDGRVADEAGAPYVEDAAATGDHVLDTLARAVERRPYVGWWRWFRHVRPDREVLVAELVERGRWTRRRGGPWPAFTDNDEGASLALSFETTKLIEGRATPKDARQGVLAVLTAMSGAAGGRPRPRALRGELKPLLDGIVATGEPGAEVMPRLLVGAAKLSRRPLRR